jgi:hypothetical protein
MRNRTFARSLQLFSCQVFGVFVVVNRFAFADIPRPLPFFLERRLQEFHMSF